MTDDRLMTLEEAARLLSGQHAQARAFYIAHELKRRFRPTLGPNPWAERLAELEHALKEPTPEADDEPVPRVGVVYVLGAGDRVKIGFTTKTVESRLSALQTGSPELLTIVARIAATAADERALQRRFRPESGRAASKKAAKVRKRAKRASA
jgi:hypothetical protein